MRLTPTAGLKHRNRGRLHEPPPGQEVAFNRISNSDYDAFFAKRKRRKPDDECWQLIILLHPINFQRFQSPTRSWITCNSLCRAVCKANSYGRPRGNISLAARRAIFSSSEMYTDFGVVLQEPVKPANHGYSSFTPYLTFFVIFFCIIADRIL
jgi:hypothetical protein